MSNPRSSVPETLWVRVTPSLSARTSNAAFKESLKQIEGSSECGGLPMISFLILPMQRVTRLPLLLDVRWPLLPHLHRNTRFSHPLLLNIVPLLVLTADNMPENKGQNSRVLRCRVGAARHEQGGGVHSRSPGGRGKKKVLSSHVTVVIVASTAGQQL